MLRGAVILAVAMAAAVLPGCGGECGEGTVRYGDTCLAVDPFDKTPPEVSVSPGVYTREVGTVRLETNEPATIYYTTDGTLPTLDSPNEADTVVIPNVPDDAQLRYFAVDRNGNRSSDELRLWIIDREGPPPPTDFQLAFNAPSRTVEWVPPPDPRFGGVLLARVEGQLTTAPVPGKQYAVGDELSPGVTVVHIDGPEVTAGAFNESLAARPGLVRYVAWGFDDLFNYGGGAGNYVVVPMPAQTGAATADASNNTFTVTTQPPHVTVTGTAALSAPTLSVEITLRNDTTRVLFAPKLVLTSALPGGITLTNATGTLDEQPYRAYGAALPPGGTASATWTFTGASSSTQLALAFDIKDNPVLYATFWDYSAEQDGGSIVDQVTGLEVLRLRGQTSGQGGEGMTHRGGFTPDGRLVVGARNAGAVTTYDLVTGSRVLTAEFRVQKAQSPQVVLDASSTTAYAVIADGHPQNLSGRPTSTELVRIDVASLTATGRIDLGVTKTKSMAMSPDGKTLLVATGNITTGVVVVDLTTFTIARRILTDFRPQTVTFVPDSIEGSSFAVVGERAALYTLDGTPGPSFPTPGTSGKVVRAIFSSPTQLWIGRSGELSVLDTTDGTSTTYDVAASMLEVYDGKLYAGSDTVARLAFDGTVELDPIPGFERVNGHWIGRSPF